MLVDRHHRGNDRLLLELWQLTLGRLENVVRSSTSTAAHRIRRRRSDRKEGIDLGDRGARLDYALVSRVQEQQGDQGEYTRVGCERPQARPHAARLQRQQTEGRDRGLTACGEETLLHAQDQIVRRGYAHECRVERLLKFSVGFVHIGLVHRGSRFL